MLAVTVPNPVVWNGNFHVKVHCLAAAPSSCRGFVDVRVPGGGRALNDYSIRPGRTTTVTTVRQGHSFKVAKTLRTITVMIEPPDGAVLTLRRRLVQRAPPVAGGDAIALTHVVMDRRGDGAGPLDLKRFTAYVRRGRLVLTWTCWRRFTAAQLDHDTGNMAAEVFKAAPHGAPGHYGAGVFYLRGSPVAKGGNSDFYNPAIRVSRPDRRSIRIAVPLSVYGKRPKQLWITPFARTDTGEDQGEFVHIRVPR
jgi:hypothetical protein